ncbi:3-(3-hydroxy-phenyl)propionate transporter MhpT [Steroidobacter sp. S1-65]|uniref:3-(3-hydroxy-phenyl)propionate transporter MhpT n=1 Tax=Steroidobacter gossypii TaxID=2805490 RepID=A0ABS1WVD5_9GAMM|nr:3-(3-hydroxy-phenyl)propionate transporter MhpT [Steroidobacter gossypii]MBM0104925.1 3-(3-hydroxy-phenyl)propionate transporter MhpT [Steroidobacter gossypii]
MSEIKHRDSGSNRTVTIVLCFCVAVLEGFDLQIIGVMAPAIRAAIELTPQQMGWIFSASLIGLAFGAAYGGWLADRLGRKPVLIGSVVVLGIFTLAAALARDVNSLLAMRFLAGLGIGGAMPNLIAVVSEVAAKGRVTGTVSLMFCGMPLGGVLVALLARFASGAIGWQGLFVIGGVLPLIVAALLALSLKETAAARGDRQRQASPGYVHNLFGEGQALRTVLLWVVFALTLLQLSLLLNWLPSLVINRGFAPGDAFITTMVVNVGSIIGSFTIGRACDRFGVRWPMFLVYLAMAVSLSALAIASGRETLWAAALAAGYFVLGSQFVLYGLAPRLYQHQARGAGVGAAVAVGRVGAISGPLLVGLALGAGASSGRVILLLVPLVIAAGAALFWLTYIAKDSLSREAAPEPSAH